MPLGSPRSDCRGRKGMLFSGISTMPVLLSTANLHSVHWKISRRKRHTDGKGGRMTEHVIRR